ncbi:Iron(3+)-hydroxamate import system permease protein FhuB [Ensifer adhaerens]|uniref:iron ABC transporter permease n=1 Tax=Ensifer adhaerens TaxID=106592 RepID=UPI0031F46B63|nr:Iron(3+)-hydroxamate import system permease protein FhuB [Ensifer adhaerens]
MRSASLHASTAVSLRLMFGLGLVLLIGLALLALKQGGGLVAWGDIVAAPSRPETLAQAIIEAIRAPRLSAAILVGICLAVAGAVMQTVLRNPLAAPDILAVTTGAQLALVIVTLLLPFYVPSLAATVFGGVFGGLACLTLGGGLRAPPVRLALAGIAVSLSFAAISSAIVLMADDRASGIVLWSAGILDQTGWTKIATVGPAVFAGLFVVSLMAPSLDLLGLGEDSARGLGVTRAVTLLALSASVVLAGSAVTLGGPIGFVGLAVPNLLRGIGITRHRHVIPLSAIWGAVAVLIADVTAQWLGAEGSSIPTGAIVACLGAPAMLVLLRFARIGQEQRPRALSISARLPASLLFAVLLVASAVAVASALAVGDGVARTVSELVAVFDLRAPRLLVAMGAGMLLAGAGVFLQAATRNPLCGPETLGLAQGAALFSLVALLGGLLPGSPGFQLVAAAGSFAALFCLFAFGVHRTPERLVLYGIALAASLGACGTIVVVEARLQTTQALSWLAGSTHARGMDDAVALLPWLLLLLVAAVSFCSRLDVLVLGDDTARSLGLSTSRTRLAAAACAAAFVAGAVSSVGAIGFVGLLAPHAGRLLAGPKHARLLPVSLVLGAVLVVVADMLGRSVIAPRELPAGIVTALVGAPVFALLLHRRRS